MLLLLLKVKNESEVSKSYPTLSDPMDCSLPGSSVHGFSRQEYWSGVPLPSLIQIFAWPLNYTCSRGREFPGGLRIKQKVKVKTSNYRIRRQSLEFNCRQVSFFSDTELVLQRNITELRAFISRIKLKQANKTHTQN